MTPDETKNKISWMRDYCHAKNAATGSKVDGNANVTCKNVATMVSELFKPDMIDIRRALIDEALEKRYGKEMVEWRKKDLADHLVYFHDETSIFPYCCAVSLYPFILNGLKDLGGTSGAPKHAKSFIGGLNNLIYMISSQFAGAVAVPEFICYMDHFLRHDFGDDYINHLNDEMNVYLVRHTLKDEIEDLFQQLVHTLNEPAGARNYQSPFTNIAYFDKNFFESIFQDFFFPDGDLPNWESTKELQKLYMKWFNKERNSEVLTFPVETANILVKDGEIADEEMGDFFAEMWAEGHSFFMYQSDSIDALASCCFSKNQKVIARSCNQGVSRIYFDTFENLGKTTDGPDRNKFEVFHNGSWCKGTKIKLKNRQMYKVVTSNNKEIIVSDNHLNPTLRGNIETSSLSTEDYLLFNTRALDSYPEQDLHLTYEQGFAVGAFLGDGSFGSEINGQIYDTNSSLIETYCCNKKLNMDCLFQSVEFRKGILDGWYNTNGGNSDCGYTTSKELCNCMEALITSLGMNSIIEVSDKTIVYPLYCIRWYDTKNERCMKDTYKVVNNSVYFKIKSIEQIDYDDDIYCFEMENADEPYFTLPNGIITHNCRLKNVIETNVFSYTLGAGGVQTGSKGVITLSLNRITQTWYREGMKVPLKDYIHEITTRVHKYLTAWNDVVWEWMEADMLPVYKAGFIDLDKQYLTVGLNSFLEAAEFLGRHNIAPYEGIEATPFNEKYRLLASDILGTIGELNRTDRTEHTKWNTEFVPGENCATKFYEWDKRDGFEVPPNRNRYNSYFFAVEDPTISPVDKFFYQGDGFATECDGGVANHINLAEHLSKEQYRKLIDVAIKAKCNYFTFNIPTTICKDCGHIDKRFLKKCPKCESNNLDYATRVIGYLKKVSSWTEAMQQEFEHRNFTEEKDITFDNQESDIQ